MTASVTAHERSNRLEAAAFRPLTHTSLGWYLWLAALLLMVAVGLAAYVRQLQEGLVVTGMGDTVIWGIYISNFVFFSGVSMAGTFISSILRITGAEWRRPLTRIAELTTVAALMMCALMPVVDMGRPDRLLFLLRHGRLQSPLVWDLVVIPTYLGASAIYLYLFLIPDSAALRDRLGSKVSGFRRRLYTTFAWGWQGLPQQRKRLEQGATVMMLLVIPLGVATHSVVSWIFGMTTRSGWNSTIFAPYFAVGALYSGTAMLITAAVVTRKFYHLEEYIGEKHFRYLSYMLIAFGVIYMYFTFAEYLTVAYKQEGGEKLLLQELFAGRYSLLVWPFFLLGQVIPIVLLATRWTRTIPVLLIASVLVNVGMWVKRYLIVVPSLANPQLTFEWGVYTPTVVEIVVTAASFAGFAMIFTVFAKLFPMVSVWEMEEGWEPGAESGSEPAATRAATAIHAGAGDD